MKILIRKSSKSSNVYIIKSYRSKGISTSQIVEKLGKLEELDKIYGNGMDYVLKRREELEKADRHFEDGHKKRHFTIDDLKLFCTFLLPSVS